MSKVEELAKQLYPDPKLEDYDDILVYRADRDNAYVGRWNVRFAYEQAEKDLGWHSIEESLPEIDEEVIVLTDELGVAPMYKIALGHIVDRRYAMDYNGWNVRGVRFWRYALLEQVTPPRSEEE